jgi:hypothetical protein
MVEPSNIQSDTDLINPQEAGNFGLANKANLLDSQPTINLISILDAYLTEEVGTDKPYLVKDGVKIIL